MLLSKRWFRCRYFSISAVSGACVVLVKEPGVQGEPAQHTSPSRSGTAYPVSVPLVYRSWEVGFYPLWMCFMSRTNGVKNYFRFYICMCICILPCFQLHLSCEDSDYVWFILLIKLLTLIALSSHVENKQWLSELSGEEFARCSSPNNYNN